MVVIVEHDVMISRATHDTVYYTQMKVFFSPFILKKS